MSLWSEIFGGEEPSLLGKPYEIKNENRKFGESTEYIAVQVEWPQKIESLVDTTAGDKEVLLFTAHEVDVARARATSNAEDVVSFLKDKEYE